MGFKLLQFEDMRTRILKGGRQNLHVAKIDLQNCCWSVRLPDDWVGQISVQVEGE